MVVAEMGHNTQREIAGVSEYAKRNGIAVDIVEGRHFGGRPDFAKWIEFWRPDGMIVDSEYAREALSDVSASALPLVVWDASMAGDLPTRCARVLSDPQAIAEAAARELLRTAFPRFAFIPALGNPLWSRQRADAFVAAVAAFGHSASAFAPTPTEATDAHRFQKGLSRFLGALETPCGVFAANDAAAMLVLKACEERSLRVPEDIALVGADDSHEYCERAEPTLTSVRMDIERGGRVAAELLATLLRDGGGDGRAVSVGRYGVETVVRRASTNVLRVRDGRVSRALEWIRLHACEAVDVSDVVAVMGCSRRLADLRFRQATGHTILNEIHARRLDKAKELLKRGDVPIGTLSERCGYVPGPSLGLLFKRTTGRTMRQWRRECLDEFRWTGDNPPSPSKPT